MAGSPSRARSRAVLLAILALAVLPPVLLVLGPFRDVFFTERVGELQRLVRFEPPPLDRDAVERWLGPKLTAAGLADAVAADFAAARHDAAMAALERVPPEEAATGVRWLHGVAALLARRPALALPGLEDAAKAEEPALAEEAEFALAQANLLLGREEAARAGLEKLARGDGARSVAAAEQLRELDAIR